MMISGTCGQLCYTLTDTGESVRQVRRFRSTETDDLMYLALTWVATTQCSVLPTSITEVGTAVCQI